MNRIIEHEEFPGRITVERTDKSCRASCKTCGIAVKSRKRLVLTYFLATHNYLSTEYYCSKCCLEQIKKLRKKLTLISRKMR